MTPTIAIGARGLAVAQLHQQLLERGVLAPEAAAEVAAQAFGPQTAGAVATFQAQSGLAADGICGPKTWQALVAGDADDHGDPVLLSQANGAGRFGRAALIAAHAELVAGVREEPPGTNRGPRVDVYLAGVAEDAPYLLQAKRDPRGPGGWAGAPWCGRFAKWCVDRAALNLGEASPLRGWGDLASALKWHHQAQTRRCLSDEPAPGRIGILLTSLGTGHLVLVAKSSGQVITTIEGNSGNRVATRQRAAIECTGGFVELG